MRLKNALSLNAMFNESRYKCGTGKKLPFLLQTI